LDILPDSSIYIFNGRHSNDSFQSAKEESLVISIAWSKYRARFEKLNAEYMLVQSRIHRETWEDHRVISQV
jgi:hypothetical protein